MTRMISRLGFGHPSETKYDELTTTFEAQTLVRTEMYASGKALAKHIASAHYGVEDAQCRACKELRAKMEAAK